MCFQYKNKTIMILGASILQVPAIKKARELGLKVIAVDMDKNAVGFKDADVSLVISTIDIPKVLNAARKYNIDGILTIASDMPVRTVARVAQTLDLPGLDIPTSFNATDKAMMREALKSGSVPIPKFAYTNNYQNYLKFIKPFKGKFIVKPVDNSGSRGVFLVEKKEDIEIAYNHSKSNSRNGVIIMEEYMEGDEVCVESVTINGETHVIAITDKITTGSPYFVEMGHTQPSSHPIEIQEQIIDITKKAIKAIGIQNGPSNTEVKITKDGVKVVELGARLSGDNITTDLVPLSTGVDMVKAAIDSSLGIIPDIEKKYSKAAAVRYFSSKEGVLKKIKGINKVNKVPEVKNVFFTKKEGEKISTIESSSERMGCFIIQTDSLNDINYLCKKVDSLVEIIVDNEKKYLDI